ncbi:heavy metal translocating P-type ATPase [Mesorhizobium sp. INR15]|uniref:heavy metal translocating P-type ATPase n=1 Tax=Mesorhizobium sp. INR15 TaxID=2654248 RepID=UPI00189658A6|nr:heavy metal translocating P-type ATPase [Mesorhizobium sp. INR15]QPC91391.1 cadmium-translocating P-type ATPase [Mesorhizobium sp. INR15]
MTASLKQTRFKIGGMDCASCAAKIDTAVRRLDGVADVSVSVTGASMTVSHGGALPEDKVLRQVARLGYGIVKADVKAGARISAGKADDHNHADHEGHDHEGHDHEGHDHGGQPAGKEAAASSHLHSDAEPGQAWWRSRRAALTLSCAAALLAAYGIGHVVPAVERWAFLAALLVGLVPIARRALMAALAGTPFSIEMLMTIAAVGAVMIGATEEAAAVVVLFLIGEMLEGVAAGRARASIQGLADLVPKTALVERNGDIVELAAEELAVGDVIVVRPGDRIPADGEIIEGSSDIDEAPVTGESTPKRKSVGEAVFAGTISTDGVLKLRVTAAASDNTIARVVRLVEEAQEAKAPTERFIDRFSHYYTPAVLVVGALVALLPPLLAGGDWNEWIYKGLAILLIGCPCALVISTPAAIAAGLATGARRGLLMKGGAVLEGFAGITAVAFDKTGTLTQGKPVVTDVLPFGRDERAVLALAAALEQGSSHPLAVAILDRAKADKAPVPPALAARAISGKGVEGKVGGVAVFLGSGQAAAERATLTEAQRLAIDGLNSQGKTVSVLVADGTVAGLIAMRDEPRADAAAGIAALKGEGIRAVMLTGDNSRTAEAIAASLGIEARAELLPQDKQRIVGELQGEGLKVAKVGDGINDAPALAAADIGIAMGGGTDVALETADAAILHGRVTDVWRMIKLSRAVMANIRQNITVALGLKVVFLVTTIAGITGLWPAILADTGATVLVTANAMRLLRWRG